MEEISACFLCRSRPKIVSSEIEETGIIQNGVKLTKEVTKCTCSNDNCFRSKTVMPKGAWNFINKVLNK